MKPESNDEVSAPVEIPEGVVKRIRTLCLALPEVTVRVDYSRTRTRSTAQSFDIRRRSFCLLVAMESSAGKSVPLLVLHTQPHEREALLSIGHPYFIPRRAGHDRVGVWLSDDTDWDEVRELVTESYRVLAPKKLTAQLEQQAPESPMSPTFPAIRVRCTRPAEVQPKSGAADETS